MYKENRNEEGAAESGIQTPLGQPSPYHLIRGATQVLNAAGDRQLIAANPAAAEHIQAALAGRQSILEALQELLVGARTNGIDLTSATQMPLGPSMEHIQRRNHSALRGATPQNRYWLVRLIGERASNEHCLMRWNGEEAELWGRSFSSMETARSTNTTLNYLDRLREVVALLHQEGVQQLPHAIATSLQSAKALVRSSLPLNERYGFDCQLRRMAAVNAKPSKQFVNPWLASRGEDITLVRPLIRTMGDGTTAHMLSFSWSEQGIVEYLLQFSSAAERATAASKIWQHFRADERPAVASGARGNPMSELRCEGLTITPDMLRSLVPGSTLVRFTPSGPESREQMLRLGIDTAGRRAGAVPLSSILERVHPLASEGEAGECLQANPELIYRDSRFTVTDHGERGVRIAFHLDGRQGERWFSHAAAAEIRAMIEAPEVDTSQEPATVCNTQSSLTM